MQGISNNEIKSVRALATKKGRDESGLFIVEGEKMVGEALRSGFPVRKVYRASEIGDGAMSRISAMSSPSPVLAVVGKPSADKGAKVSGPGLYLALDAIRDPGNLGTIVRIADWFGIDGVFASWDTAELWNPKAVQATMGAIFRVPFAYTDLPGLCAEVRSLGGAVHGTFLGGEDIYRADLGTDSGLPAVIVIGNEAHGISAEVAAQVTSRLFIPPFPPDRRGSESLNAATATAIAVAEFRRQSM